MRKAANTDITQRAIVSALRTAGYSVWLTPLGSGFPDCLIALRNWLCLVEIKSLGGKAGGRGKSYTPAQLKFHADWPCPILTLQDPTTAVAEVEVFKKRYWG